MVNVVRNIKDVLAKEVAPGVKERILLLPEETASKALTVKLLLLILAADTALFRQVQGKIKGNRGE